MTLPASMSAKVLLLNEMLAQNVRPADLARLLGTTPQPAVARKQRSEFRGHPEAFSAGYCGNHRLLRESPAAILATGGWISFP